MIYPFLKRTLFTIPILPSKSPEKYKFISALNPNQLTFHCPQKEEKLCEQQHKSSFSFLLSPLVSTFYFSNKKNDSTVSKLKIFDIADFNTNFS